LTWSGQSLNTSSPKIAAHAPPPRIHCFLSEFDAQRQKFRPCWTPALRHQLRYLADWSQVEERARAQAPAAPAPPPGRAPERPKTADFQRLRKTGSRHLTALCRAPIPENVVLEAVFGRLAAQRPSGAQTPSPAPQRGVAGAWGGVCKSKN